MEPPWPPDLDPGLPGIAVVPDRPPEDEDPEDEDDEEEPDGDGRPAEGIDEPEPLRPEGEGRLDELPPERPEEPEGPLGLEEPPDDPPEDGEGIDEGIDDDCWLAQPPIRNADTVLTAVACAATMSSRFHG